MYAPLFGAIPLAEALQRLHRLAKREIDYLDSRPEEAREKMAAVLRELLAEAAHIERTLPASVAVTRPVRWTLEAGEGGLPRLRAR